MIVVFRIKCLLRTPGKWLLKSNDNMDALLKAMGKGRCFAAGCAHTSVTNSSAETVTTNIPFPLKKFRFFSCHFASMSLKKSLFLPFHFHSLTVCNRNIDTTISKCMNLG
jgi:hypothetical protein